MDANDPIPHPQDPLPHSVIATDIENWSGCSPRAQLKLRSHLREVMDEACRAIGLEHLRWVRQDQGDGELALVPADIPKPRLVADLVRELATALRLDNRDRTEAARMRLRIALHHGEAHVEGTGPDTGFAGAAPVVACRLLDAEPVRRALKAVAAADLAVILSAEMYAVTVLPGCYRDLEPEDFRRVSVTVKTYRAHAWIRVPGHPAAALPDLEAATGSSTSAPASEKLPASEERKEPEGQVGEQHGGDGQQPAINVVTTGPVSLGGGIASGRDTTISF